MTLPDFLIVGVHRAGTTALWEWLRSHPEVFMARPKEVHFFDKHYDKGIDWYEQRFARAPAQAICGEATPNYIYHRDALRMMAQLLPNAKLIVSLRNPIDQAYSQYWHRRLDGGETRSFEDAYPTLSHTDAYLSLLRRVCEFYPREALKPVFYEELMDAYGQICRFIGVNDVPPPQPDRRAGAYIGVRSIRFKRATDRLRKLPAPRALRRVGSALRRANTTALSYPPIDPALRAQLGQRIDVGPLKVWLGRELPPEWGEFRDSSLTQR